MSDNIKVVVKVRPLIFRELEDKLSYQWRINNNTLYQLDQNGRDCGPSFTFDKVYDTETRTDAVYNDIAKPIVEAATAGFNGTIFAYGQTSSGKTYTMTGTDDAPGIIPLAVLNLFDIIRNIPDRDFLVRVSYVEIYNESFIDLLDLTKKVKIQETLQGIKVCTTEKLTISPEQVLELMRQGKANRQTGSTNMNEESSRSHSIFQITIESREHIEGEQEVGSVNVSQLNLVDLAGSERSGQTGATGIRFKEGTHINKSLSSLALVIKQLSEDPNKHVNYRDSKLTRILQNSLGGNAKTSIICAVTPAAVEETISTLQFANRAKAIKNTPAVNLVATNATMIQSLTKQLSSLKTQLESKKNVEQDNYNLQKQIANLQKMILNGFGQNRNTDIISTARRKLVHPRRVTISTLHPIQEDPVPLVPKFCTPSLKYNPLSVRSAAESACSAAAVREDTLCDVIEIDSDDDISTDIEPCSPYHECYKSKTPPCVLRNNAKQAEKNLKDIVELTKREKIYTPNVVELMEQLEHKSLALTKLEDNITNLHSVLKDKDQEMDRLKSNIIEAQDEIKSISSDKAKLEMTCNDYSTKITDWEVSFETLKKKSKSREDELLSLLKENEIKKKNEPIGKLSSKAVEKELKNFMDLSRDISLVNSSVENSIIETETRRNCCADLRNQVTLRDQTISQLEANLDAQKLKIENLENINEKLQVTVSSLNEKLSLLETENSNLKYSMDSLSKTISGQKSLIEIANTDIESYCSHIRELQIKLNKKEDTMTDISDTDLEAMIANEELFIANNENMKNIIESLKIALDTRNKEIQKLKSDLDNNQNLSSLEEFDTEKNEISSLRNEVVRLKKELTDNVSIIDTLLQEKDKMKHVEKQLTFNFATIQEQKDLLDKEIEVHMDKMTKLNDFNIKLTTELKAKEEEIMSINKENDNENRDLCQKISKLEATIKNKEGIIASLKKDQNGTRENIEKVKLGLTKVQNIITLLTGDINVIPDFVDNLVVAFSTLADNLSSLESITKDTIKDKKYVIAKLEHSEIELNTLHTKINGLNETMDEFYNEYETLILGHLNGDELVNGDMNACDKLINKINNLLSTIKTIQTLLNQTIKDKNDEINECKINFENKSKELNEESQKNITQLQQICDLTSSRNLILKNISEKLNNLTSKFCIENNISCQIENVCENMSEQVILTIDKIDNHISLLQSEHSKCDNNEHVLGDAKNKILQVTEENLKLVQYISDLETNKAVLSDEIDKVQKESINLRDDLKGTNHLINQLRENLSIKSSEIEIIENKAKSWKDSFTDLECMMQDKINLLEAENIKLKLKCSELEMQDLPKCYENEENLASGDQECYSRKDYIQVNSPPSLLTICCNSIADAIDLNDDKSVTSSSSFTELSESKISTNKCNCKDLLADLQKIIEEKNKLNITIERLQNENEDLLKEREDVQKEVQLLLEHSYELQKRVVNHRTILSTLTATTYAENKSLSSQIKFLQHHLSRFHHVCQKVIPTFKRQLYDLMTLLKSECLGKHNESFKRYSLPNALDTSSLHCTFKNESIFDNDLLMLDTNVTLTTCDNTMTPHDQTCFDATQVWVSNEVACQTNFSEVTKDPLYPQMSLQPLDENKVLETLESLKTENDKLRDLVDDFTKKKSKVLVTTLSSPIKFPDTTDQSCKKCDQHVDNIRVCKASHKSEIDAMSKKLSDLECEKNSISEKCHNLALEVPSSEVLVRRLSALENELQIKVNEIERLTIILNKTNKTLKSLQEENESLSNEIMENISEIDAVKCDQDNLKETNTKLTQKLFDLGKELESFESEKKHKTVCNNCALKDETIKSLQKSLLVTESHSKLDRSYSDADSSSRYNKICTLQNELHAGKEDCIELKEEVTTIKKHLEDTNLSISQNMDLDESIIDSPMYSFSKDFGNTNENKFNLSNVPEKRVIDAYISDKTDCFSYYCEKTGIDKETLNGDFKIIEVMKMLYLNFSTKHANEIQNLVNKLKDFEEAKNENNLQAQINKIKEEQSAVLKELKEKDGYLQKLAEILSHIRDNINLINEKLGSEEAFIIFRTTFLKILDTEFGLSSSNIFESIIQQLNEKHNKVIEINAAEIGQLKETTQRMVNELNSVNDNLLSLKSQLNEKQTELELLQRQKEKMHEISNAVTIDIIRKEKELKCQLTLYYRKLLESNIIKEDIDLSLPLNESMNILFNFILNQLENKESEEEKLKIVSELANLKTSLLLKDEDLKLLREDINRIVSEHEQKLLTQTSLHNDLNKIYAKKVEENEIYANTINKLTEEINLLKNNVASKDGLLKSLETKHSKDLLERQSEQINVLKNLQNVQKELEDLKSINHNILMEKEACAIELDGVKSILIEKNLEIDKFVSEIDKLKQSMNENSQIIENLKLKSDILQQQLQEKCTNCIRLETNMKTHEKTASIQISIINRLQEQKADIVKGNSEKDKQIETMTQKCKSLEEECLKLTTEIQTDKEEIEKLNSLKQTLELRISELETHDAKPRLSIDSVAETTRRRRQSIHDSKRIFADDVQDHKILEDMLNSRSKTDELFMDVDGDSSSRSTPIRLSRGRDSHLSKHDQSDKDDEQSRPGSAAAAAAAARRRRRTAYDSRRGTENSFESSGSFDGEAAHFRRLLSICQEELEELRQRYKEVDEECETCAQYLRERDEQCLRLKKEKAALENTIMDLREKMKTMTANDSTNTKTTFTDVSVNTEEDWTNLHSVFVDRMSYDAEVEKNKKLMRTIEELRFKKQELKNTMTRMQKALDKKANKDSQELESTQAELATCKQELEELKERYKELDEECETCAEYLRERDEQCQKLKEIKKALESKLEEYQESGKAQSIRKRRQTLHDQNRRAPAGVDAATDTSDDLLSYQVERDDTKLKQDDTKEIKRLKMVVDKLSQHKASLEQQLTSVGTQYAATGSTVVQNQHLSDVLKENQKLKKINAKLVTICKKRDKLLIDSNIENEDPSQKTDNKN